MQVSSKQPGLHAPAAANADGGFISTFGVICLLAFCFVIIARRLPLGEVAALGSVAAAFLAKGKFQLPLFYRWYLLYVLIGVAGLAATRYSPFVVQELINVGKMALIGVAAFNVLTTPRACRFFAVGYLALFALFPVRGALYNYVNGITEQGRIAWNFFFANPNDLAMSCFLPLGLCAYLIVLERDNKWIKLAAWAGLIVLIGVQMLSQSRGAMLALGAGGLYLIIQARQRARLFLLTAVLMAVAAALTPSAVWDRVAGLTKLGGGDVAEVDPEGSAAGRATLMKIALGIANDNPVLGIGFGAYGLENERVTRGNSSVGQDERGARDAHSTYLRAAAETGWIGALCIVLCIGGAIASCRRGRKKLESEGAAVNLTMSLVALEASMIAYAVGAVVNSAERSTFFTLQFVVCWTLAMAVVRSASRQGDDRIRDSLTSSVPASGRQRKKAAGRILAP